MQLQMPPSKCEVAQIKMGDKICNDNAYTYKSEQHMWKIVEMLR